MKGLVMDVLETLLDNLNTRIERLLSETFEAGIDHIENNGPAFEAWLKERMKR